MQNIKEFFRDSWVDELIWFCLFFVLLLLSFSFGALFERGRLSSSMKVEVKAHSDLVDIWKNYEYEQKTNAKYFGSKNGTTLYPLECKAGNRIAEKNKVFFNNLKKAQDTGYTLSSRCNLG